MIYNTLNTKHITTVLSVFALAILLPFSVVFADVSNKSDKSDHATTQHDEHSTETDDHGHPDDGHGEVEPYDPAEFAMHHVQDLNEWHLWGDKAIPLPIIAYSKDGGLMTGMSSMFHHGHTAKNGYVLNHGKLMKVQDASFPKEETEVHVFEKEIVKDGEATSKYYVSHNGNDYEVARSGFIDFSITKNVLSMLLVALIMGFIFIKVARAYKTREGKAPKGIQSFFEPLIVFVRDEVAKPNLGKHSEKYMPYLLTVFFFIWMLNMLGQLPIFPGGANVTGNIAVTAVLAVITFVLTQLAGTKHYWAHTFLPPVPKWLYPIMVPVEVAGLFIKPMALMIRLFANITAGHILVLSLVGLIFIFSKGGASLAGGLGGAAVAVPFTLFILCIELLVAFLQAFIFTILSAVFIGLAIDEGH